MDFVDFERDFSLCKYQRFECRIKNLSFDLPQFPNVRQAVLHVKLPEKETDWAYLPIISPESTDDLPGQI